MDALLALIPTQYIPYATAAVTICAALAMVLPHPAAGSTTAYAKFYGAVNWIAMNKLNAKNATPTTGA